MKCKNCEHYKIRYYTPDWNPHRKSFDGYECRETGRRVEPESIITDCPKNKKPFDFNAEFVRVD